MPEAVCPDCGGSGWKIVERESGSGAERCACRGAERTSLIEERAGIPPLYRNASLDNFKLPADNPTANRGLANVLIAVKGYAKNFPSLRAPGLLLVGTPGSGKTHLAVAALRMLINKGHEGIFVDYQALLEKIQNSFDVASGATDRAMYRTALEAEILLIDDLGSRRVSDWVEDTMCAIITDRCNNRKPLIATTNLKAFDLGHKIATRLPDTPDKKYGLEHTLPERLGERAYSRLFEMCRILQMPDVHDYRVHTLQKQP